MKAVACACAGKPLRKAKCMGPKRRPWAQRSLACKKSTGAAAGKLRGSPPIRQHCAQRTCPALLRRSQAATPAWEMAACHTRNAAPVPPPKRRQQARAPQRSPPPLAMSQVMAMPDSFCCKCEDMVCEPRIWQRMRCALAGAVCPMARGPLAARTGQVPACAHRAFRVWPWHAARDSGQQCGLSAPKRQHQALWRQVQEQRVLEQTAPENAGAG